MGKKTSIAWTDHTFNPWIGCTKVGPGCDGCYAEALDKRHRWGGATHWGSGVPRHRTRESTWRQPLQWDKAAKKAGHRPRVFCASLADVFDNEVPDFWRTDLFDMIYKTPNLDWLLVTKRIGNVKAMMQEVGNYGIVPSNVRIMITVVNQEEANRDIPKLLALRCKNGVSYEPALGQVDFGRFLASNVWKDGKPVAGSDYGHGRKLDWIIVGGESNQGKRRARQFNIEWARTTIDQCNIAGVACFVKQIGSSPIFDVNDMRNPGLSGDTPMIGDGRGSALAMLKIKDRSGADQAEWPADLRIQQFPE